MITLEQAKALTHGITLYHVSNRDSQGFPERWRVNGQPKTWKRDPSRVEVPLKHGLRSYDTLTQRDLHLVCLEEDEAYTPQEWDAIRLRELHRRRKKGA